MKGENCSIIRSRRGTSLIRVRVRAGRRSDITKVLSAILRVDRQEQRGVQDYAKVEFKQKISRVQEANSLRTVSCQLFHERRVLYIRSHSCSAQAFVTWKMPNNRFGRDGIFLENLIG